MRLSSEAEDDLRAILQYTLETWGPEQQDMYEASIADAFDQLARFPNLGRTVAGSRAGARRFRVEQHVIFYVADEEEVRIGRIVHRKMEGTGDGAG